MNFRYHGEFESETPDRTMIMIYQPLVMEKSLVPTMEVTPLSLTKVSQDCSMTVPQTYMRSSFTPIFPALESSEDVAESTDYTRCIPSPFAKPKCKEISMETFFASVPDKKMKNGNYVNVSVS